MAARKTVIKNVRVFDGNALTEPRSVVIDGGIISSNEDGADEVIEGNNGFLLPGLIDAHVHLHHEGHLLQLAQYGVTTALDMASWPASKINGLRNKIGVSDIRSAGLPATAPGSVHSCILPLPEEALRGGPEGAEEWVQKRVDEGSDYIKIICDVPGPTQDTLNAITSNARQHGKKVVAHASCYIPFQMAMEAKADIITHAPRDKPVDAEIAKAMLAANVVSCPTLIMMEEVSKPPPMSIVLPMLLRPFTLAAIIRAQRAGVGKQIYENARLSVKAMHEAGVPILAGTDCHDEPGSPADVKHGYSLHQELELLVGAGLSTVDTLRSATIVPTQWFDLPDRGVIAEGKRADLVLLREDPIKDIRATRSIERVWCAGVEVKKK